MSTGAFSQLITKDFSSVFFDEYSRQDTEFDKVANVSTMDGAYIREGQLAGLKALQGVGEGEPAAYDGFVQGNEKTVLPSDFALGVAITRNMYNDDRTGYMKKAFAELGKAAAYTRELKFWDLLNAGFVTTTRVGVDGAALFASHTLVGGGTYSNYASSASSLTMTTLQAMCDRFELLPNERGIPIRVKPKLLIVPPALRWKAEQLIKSEYNPENANNEINSITGVVPGLQYMVCHFLSSTTAWFIAGDKSDHDLRFIWRQQLQLQSTDDFDTRTAKFMAAMRLQTTFFGWRGVDGNAGA
jgi:phage major head subunit gpT-like protein